MIIEFLLYLGSLGLSDAIELYFNPLVHQIHNAPDLARKPWADYTYFDAFMSAITCSWILLIPFVLFMVLGVQFYWIYPVVIANLLTPVVTYVTDWQTLDPFMSHKILYLTGFVYFVALLVVHVVKWMTSS